MYLIGVHYRIIGSPCWLKGTLSDFILMITNHMKLFGTNQVFVFLSISGSKDILFCSSSKGRYSCVKIIQGKGSSLDDQDLHLEKPS